MIPLPIKKYRYQVPISIVRQLKVATQPIGKLIFLFNSNIDSIITQPFSFKVISIYSFRLNEDF